MSLTQFQSGHQTGEDFTRDTLAGLQPRAISAIQLSSTSTKLEVRGGLWNCQSSVKKADTLSSLQLWNVQSTTSCPPIFQKITSLTLNQWGFRTGHSTKDSPPHGEQFARYRQSLVLLVSPHSPQLIFCVWHSQPPNPPLHSGWTWHCLTNRPCPVTWNVSLFKPFLLETGVPKGSIFGQVLFSLYTRSLGCAIISHITCHGIAIVYGEKPGHNPRWRAVLRPQHHCYGLILQICPLQHPQDLVFSHNRCSATPGPSTGHLPPGLLQLPLGWTATKPLQHIQNVQHVMLTIYPYSLMWPCLLHDLHWLPVAARIWFKMMVLAFKAVNRTAPVYLQTLVRPHARSTPRALNSSTSAGRLIPPLLRENKANSAKSQLFSVLATQWWKRKCKCYLPGIFHIVFQLTS